MTNSLTNGIEAPRRKRMAAQQAAEAHTDTAGSPIPAHRFQHVFRARRMKPAGGGQHRREEPFVEAQSSDHRFPHCEIKRSSDCWRSWGDALSARRRGLITTSHRGSISEKRSRKASRKRRFTRFRLTARPKARGTVNPSLGPSPSGRWTARQNAAKQGPEIRAPSA
jgi:hypothetical protein